MRLELSKKGSQKKKNIINKFSCGRKQKILANHEIARIKKDKPSITPYEKHKRQQQQEKLKSRSANYLKPFCNDQVNRFSCPNDEQR
jgi:hypothetical protein